MTKVNREWAEELDNLIDNDYWSYPEDERSMIFTTGKIKDFISNLLSQTHNNLLRELMEEMPKTPKSNGHLAQEWIDGHGYAIDQVNTLLERKLSIVKKI